MKPDAVGTNSTDNAGITADGTMRFLRELRQLRSEAGLESTELAARAHYPHDVIVAAEAGPSLPGLPVLSAYVRGCGAVLTDWEERWRSLSGSPAAPICLPARPVGCSTLASAGARATGVPPVDLEAQRRIMAAITKASAVDAVAAIPPQVRALPPADSGPTPTSPTSVQSAAARPGPQSSMAERVSDGRVVPAQVSSDRIVPPRTAPEPATAPAPPGYPAPLMPTDSVPSAADAPAMPTELSKTLLVRPPAPVARRQPKISRVKIAVTVAAVVFAVGAIIMLLLRKG